MGAINQNKMKHFFYLIIHQAYLFCSSGTFKDDEILVFRVTATICMTIGLAIAALLSVIGLIFSIAEKITILFFSGVTNTYLLCVTILTITVWSLIKYFDLIAKSKAYFELNKKGAFEEKLVRYSPIYLWVIILVIGILS